MQIKIKTRILWISNVVLLQNLIVSNRLKQSKEVLKRELKLVKHKAADPILRETLQE